MRDTLFLLAESFIDGPGQPYYCPDCAQVTGVLTYFPKIRHDLDIRYVDYPRPRDEIIGLIGPDHQGCPVLILSHAPSEDAKAWVTGQSNGLWFVSGAKAISQYWSHRYNVSRPH